MLTSLSCGVNILQVLTGKASFHIEVSNHRGNCQKYEVLYFTRQFVGKVKLCRTSYYLRWTFPILLFGEDLPYLLILDKLALSYYSGQTSPILLFKENFHVLLLGLNFPVILFGVDFPCLLFSADFYLFIILDFCEQLVSTWHLRLDGDIPLTGPHGVLASCYSQCDILDMCLFTHYHDL